MNLKKLFALALSLLMILSFSACNGTSNSGAGDGGSSGDSAVTGPLSGESDDALISRFVSEYENAVSATAYATSYSIAVRLDGDPLWDAVGSFLVNGDQFSVTLNTDLWDAGETLKVSCAYLDGTLYTVVNGVETVASMDAATAKAQLDTLGLTYRKVPVSQFASKTLTRNPDGTFSLHVTLTEGALQEISSAVLSEAAETAAAAEFMGVTLEIVFSSEGKLMRSVLTPSVLVTVGDASKRYSTELYVQYETFDPSKIEIEAPEV